MAKWWPEKRCSAPTCSKDLFAGIRDIVGGRSGTYEKEPQRTRDVAIQEMAERAQALGANAVVDVDLDYEVLGRDNGMPMVPASGTSVVHSIGPALARCTAPC